MHTRRRLVIPPWCLAIGLSFVAWCSAAGGDGPAGARSGPRIDYARQVKPLLTRHCVGCHGASRPRSGLRLDTAAAAFKGGKQGPAIVPGHGEESPLVLALRGDGEGERMPLNRPPLGEAEIRLIRDWIDAGAAAPSAERPGVPPAAAHWAFIPPRRPVPPEVHDRGWVRNPIDRFILARLEQAGLTPSPRGRPGHVASPGQPRPGRPAPVARRMSRPSWPIGRPIATKRAVDRLLASPHFGERWARPWLDQARYADSNGYSIDAPRSIWKYRDWVIAAFNDDLPFDRFVIDQIAGDLRPGATIPRAHRHRVPPQHADQPGGRDRRRAVPDRIDRGPGQHDGDRLARPDDRLRPVPRPQVRPDQPARLLPALRLLQQRGRARPGDRHAGGAGPSPRCAGADRSGSTASWPRGIRTSTNARAGGRSRCRPPSSRMRRSTPSWRSTCRPRSDDRRPSAACSSSCSSRPIRPSRPSGRRSRSCGPPSRKPSRRWWSPSTRARSRRRSCTWAATSPEGASRSNPAVPAVLPPLEGVSPGNRPDRMDLARWLVGRSNPLAARVAVNRIWQAYFGRGLVETDNDFGTQGSPPSHPELLDWLACELMDRGWSLKAIHRLIVESATYRQASAHPRRGPGGRSRTTACCGGRRGSASTPS